MGVTDRFYIQRCLDGYSEDFRLLVQRYQTVLLAHTAGKLGDRNQAEEVTQEVFVRAYFNLKKLKKPESFLAWLFGIADHVVKEHQRSKQQNRQIADSLPEKSPMSAHSRDCALEQAIAELPDKYRQMILLRYYAGLSCCQVAEQLNMPLGTVTKNLSRAYAALRKSLLRQEQNEKL